MTLGDIIRDYRATNGLSMDAFAEKSGISKAYISLLEKNRHPKTGKPIMPSLSLIKSAADAMGIDFNILLSRIDGDVSLDTLDTDFMGIAEIYSKLDTFYQERVFAYAQEQFKEQNNATRNKKQYREIKVTEKLAAGRGYSYSENNDFTYVKTDRDDLANYSLASFVTGDSMYPAYEEGDVVLIQQGYDNCQGAVYAIDYDGKSFLKKVYFEGNRFRLVSINENYSDIYIGLPIEDDTYLNIVGRVVDKFKPVEG